MLAPTEEQQMLRDTAARVVRDATAGGLPEERDPAAVWSSAGELGWLALPFDEADGGLGGRAPEICALTIELGRSLSVGSYVVGTVLPGRLVAQAPAGPLRASLLDGFISGARAVAFADTEPKSRGAWSPIAARARRSGDAWILEGAKTNVWSCGETRTLLTSAVDTESGGQLVLAVDLGAPGLRVREYDTLDGGRALDVELADVAVRSAQLVIPPGQNVREVRESAWELACVATAAECVGIMKALVEMTAEHLRSRKQFGQPLARLQVLRHRMADMALATRRAEALGSRAARQLAVLDASDRARLVSAACVKALGGVRFVCEQAVQLHGGMGVSAELPVGRYLRRVLALEATFGGEDHHRARFQSVAHS